MNNENREVHAEKLRDFLWGEFLPAFGAIIFSAFGIIWMAALAFGIVLTTYFIGSSDLLKSRWRNRTYLFLIISVPLLLLNGIIGMISPLILLFLVMGAFLIIEVLWWNDISTD